MKRRFEFIGLFSLVLWLAWGCQTTDSMKYCFKLPDYDEEAANPDDDRLFFLYAHADQSYYPTGVLPLHEKDQQDISYCIEQNGLKLVNMSSLVDWDVKFNHVEPGLVRVYLTHRKDQAKLAFAVLHTSRGWQIVAYKDVQGKTHVVKD
ncbi:MAG: hypothetical protein WC058_03640 [Phycisphaeraceae bacterium]